MRTRAMRRVRARNLWDRLTVSLWFVPAVMGLAGLLLAWFMVWVDSLIPDDLLYGSRFVLAGTAGELRSALLNIATTVLATAGVVFTLLTLPLSTVAAQYGSRLLRLFLGDRTTKFVLGMFVTTFIYCIAAALSIPPPEVDPNAPQLTVSVGILLMMATFATLIMLVQHISTMLQAPNIAAAAGAELLDVVRLDIPAEITSAEDQALSRTGQTPQGIQASLLEADGYPVRVRKTGYLQMVDPQVLLALAQEHDLLVRLLLKPGAFVSPGTAVALVWPAAQVDEPLDKQLRRAFRVGNLRTPTQDVECAVNQLVEMAVRAMSPAINDPFTAMTCLDHLGLGLAMFAQHGGESSESYDQDGRLRLVFEQFDFADLLGAAFDMLRHAACDNATVLLHMLRTIDVIGRQTRLPAARQELLRHVSLIQAESQAGALIAQDRQLIEQSSAALLLQLQDAPLAQNTRGMS